MLGKFYPVGCCGGRAGRSGPACGMLERLEQRSAEKRDLHCPRKASESSTLMGLKTLLFSSRTRVKTTLGERVWTVVTGVLDVAVRKAHPALHLDDSSVMMFGGPHTLDSS